MNIVQAGRLSPLFDAVFKEIVGTEEVHKSLELVFAAGKFYLQALQSVQTDAEIAFLHLINAGEVLANATDIEERELFDDNTWELLQKIKTAAGDSTYRAVKKRLFQVRRKFRITLSRLLTEQFYMGSESTYDALSFKRERIEEHLNAAYDLRSLYLHKGTRFGGWILPIHTRWRTSCLVHQPMATPLGKS